MSTLSCLWGVPDVQYCLDVPCFFSSIAADLNKAISAADVIARDPHTAKGRRDCPFHSLTPKSRTKPQLPQIQASYRSAPSLSPVPALSNCAGSFSTCFERLRQRLPIKSLVRKEAPPICGAAARTPARRASKPKRRCRSPTQYHLS